MQRIREWFISLANKRSDPITRYLSLTVVLVGVAALVMLWFYDRTHLFDGYSVTSSADLTDVDGTQYEMLGGRLIKYSHDGVFCTDLGNNVLWSVPYNMQTPAARVRDKVMLIFEQQGNEAIVINRKGVVGHFKTDNPIRKAGIAENGVVAALFEEGDEAWIRLFSPSGEMIAAVKASMEESGYPVDMALNSNGSRMMVSYLGIRNGSLSSRISFYDFSSGMSSTANHLLGTVEYPNTLFPRVYYADTTPVAVCDDGCVIFASGRRPLEKSRVTLNDEIISVFYDDTNIGFVLPSDSGDRKYKMDIYSIHGKQVMSEDFDEEYTNIRMEDKEVVLGDGSRLYVWRLSGREKLSASYDKDVEFFASLKGVRNYLVITDESIDRIKLK